MTERKAIWVFTGAAVGALATTLAAKLRRPTASRQGQGKPHKKAFLLIINLTFKTIGDREKFFELWKPLAEHVAEHEPDCLAYEASVSDKNGVNVLIYERYANKDIAFLKVHRSSAPFKKFQERMANEVDVVSKTGESYIESDIGFA